MDFRLLGRLEVEDQGRVLQIPGVKPRALLAVLLLNRNQPISFSRLIQALWPRQQPAAARQSLQYFVHQLRRVLEPDPRNPQVLQTEKASYRLRVAPGRLDVDRFQDAVIDARRARSAGDLDAALAAFQQALALWRGTPLADFPDEDFAQGEIARLEELRLAVTIEQLQTTLELGRHAELIGELDGMVRSHPLREELRSLQMLALYRSGRQVEALAAYRAAHEAFVDRLGIEPGSELQRLRQQIVDQDPVLGAAQGGLGAAPGDRGDPAPGHDVRPPAAATPDHAATPPPAASQAPAEPAARPAGRGLREERKVVTILVAGAAPAGGAEQVDPEEVDPEDVRGHLDAAFGLVRAQVKHYGGVVQALVADQVLAVFGAPRSSEDDPERAVRAALEICAGAAETGHAVRVGVATGEVVMTLPAGDAGDDQITVVGDVVHAAAALEALAPPGGVVAGAGTYRATRRVIQFQALRRASPLEQASGSAVWLARAPRGRTGATVPVQDLSPLVERERELLILKDLLRRFLRGREPFMVSLISDPGLGKTRLVAELGNLADAAPNLVTWRRGRSLPHEQGTFWALSEVVKSHAGIHDNDSVRLATAKLEQMVTGAVADADEARWVAHELSVLLAPDLTAPVQEQRKQEVFAGWARFLQAAAAERPLVVVLEDMQWADDALLEFADDLVDLVPAVPLLVVVTGRPELLERRPVWGGGKRNAATMSLSPLSRKGTEDLLDALLDGTVLPGDTREAMLTSSGGNPLYVEEYVRMLHDLRAPGLDGSLPIPESVQQLIAARIDALPADDKVLLQDAAVVGEVGWLGALRSLGDRDLDETRQGFRRLERRGLLRRMRISSVAAETEYTFRHALVRDVAYAGVLRGDRIGKHRQVATWVESLNPERVDDRVDLLAHHYTRALDLVRASGQPDQELTARARSVLRAAGDRSLGLGAYASAERSFAAALELWPEQGNGRAEVLFGLARARVYGAHGGEDVLLAARDAFEAAGDEDRAAAVDIVLDHLARIEGRAADADAHLDRALTRNTDPTGTRAQALATRAIDLMLVDRYDEAMEAAEEARRIAAPIGLPDVESTALTAIGGARLKLGDVRGLDDIERGVALAEHHRLPTVHLCRFDLVWGLWWLGDLDRCTAEVAKGSEAATAAGAVIVDWFDGVQAGIDYAAGRWDEVASLTDRALKDPSSGYLDPWHYVLRGRIRLARGDLTGALDDASSALAVAEKAHDTRARQFVLSLRARALVAAGHNDEATSVLDRLLSEQRDRPRASCATTDLAAVMIDLGRPAGELADGLPPTYWHLAVRALAERNYDQAARAFARIGSPADEALVWLYAARHLTAAGRLPAADAGLERAVAFYRMAGATASVTDAEALLARPGTTGG